MVPFWLSRKRHFLSKNCLLVLLGQIWIFLKLLFIQTSGHTGAAAAEEQVKNGILKPLPFVALRSKKVSKSA